jgi:alpha-L-fucosidase
MTLNDSWGYNEADDNWKSAKQVLMHLARCASGGGNFLLNVGPKPDGTIPSESVRILEKVGNWMDRNGGSIYGTSRSQFSFSSGMSTVKGSTLYLHVFRWPGKELHVPRILNTVRSVHLLKSGKQVRFEQDGDRLKLTGLPGRAPDDLDTVIVVELDGEPLAQDYFRDGWFTELIEKADVAMSAASGEAGAQEASAEDQGEQGTSSEGAESEDLSVGQ